MRIESSKTGRMVVVEDVRAEEDEGICDWAATLVKPKELGWKPIRSGLLRMY